GDGRFLELLEKRGVRFIETDEGLLADGSGASFEGFNENFCDFSDQTITAAALAPFASSPSCITGIAHIKKQECDRITAIEKNLNALGVPSKSGDDFIEIQPALPKGGTVETFHDHRVAMAFALTALKTGNITIDDSECCNKTFEGYFNEIEKLFIE
ncbi:MAG: 3-phosphoshikimate 1-carboxyvinyltransferase, partial [Clostridia bacterium]|nr:3-phosphoshikimate 1-carboxyvinyltransferase [Clostridia bacterium]